MGKRGPRPKATDAEIINLLLSGQTNAEVAKALGVSESKVKVVKRTFIKPNQNVPTVELLKAVVKLEITQENTLSELSSQLAEYTEQYNEAKKAGDERSAYAWSQNRLKIIDMMAKITGLYNPRPVEQQTTDPAITITFELVD